LNTYVRAAISGLLVGLVAAAVAWGYLTDTTIRPVADDGTQFDRDTWNPTNGSFPGVGGTYTDPIFGEVLKRLTNIRPGAGSSLTFRSALNADGTKFFWRNTSASNTLVHVLDTAGTQVETNIPGGFGTGEDAAWDPFNPAIYYYWTGTTISQRNIATDTTSTVKTFGSTLTGVGSEHVFIAHHEDDTANPTNLLFLVAYGGNIRVWNKQSDVELTGSMVNTSMDWATFSPDGRWIIKGDNLFPATFYSLRVDVIAGTVGNGTAGQTGTPFWQSMNGSAHGAPVSLTNGKTYVVTAASQLERWQYRVDVSLDQTGQSTAVQAAANTRLFMTDASGQTANPHYSCGMQGAMRNYCWISTEDYPETAAAPGTWYAHKQEIILVHVPTAKVFRMAHHRSYPLQSRFCSNPRVNASLDGTHAVFTSGMGIGTAEASCGYGDVYLLDGSSVTQVKPWARRRHVAFD
jgi:hypothetical protein